MKKIITGLALSLAVASLASAAEEAARFGCAYYPEAWGEENWERDLELMRETGLEFIRIGEFKWGKFEPEEGVFDFDEYSRFLDLCDRHGMKVIMCTPTTAVPRWMHARYPETEKLRDDGTRPSPDSERSSRRSKSGSSDSRQPYSAMGEDK